MLNETGRLAVADPYLPTLAGFSFDADEQAVIALALGSDKPWEYVPSNDDGIASLKSAKRKILELHLERHGWTCCYCRTDLKGAGPFMTDREHILPKGKAAYKSLSYTLWNLAAACKRCNLQFKGSGDKFVIDSKQPAAFVTSDNYRFVHPNFDRWEDHLARFAFYANAKSLVKIMRKPTAKANYTYEFFKLMDFDIDNFDTAQGLENGEWESVAVLALRKLIEQFGQ